MLILVFLEFLFVSSIMKRHVLVFVTGRRKLDPVKNSKRFIRN